MKNVLELASQWCGRMIPLEQARTDVLNRLSAAEDEDQTAVVLVGGLLTSSGLTTLLQIFRNRFFVRALEAELLSGWTMNPGAVRSQHYPRTTSIIELGQGVPRPVLTLDSIELLPLQRTLLTVDGNLRVRWTGPPLTSEHGFHLTLFGHGHRTHFTKVPGGVALEELTQLDIPFSIPAADRDLYTVFVEIVEILPGGLEVEQAVSNALMEVLMV